jgi:hypothetical protein
MTQTNQRIQEIKERLKNTTPGKWYVNYLDDSYHMNLVAITTRPDTGKHEAIPYDDSDKSIRNSIVATTLFQAGFEETKPFVSVEVDEFNELIPDKGGRWDDDAEFIANAKDDIEYLLNILEKLTVTED